MPISATIGLKRGRGQQLPRELDPEGEGLVYGQTVPRLLGTLDRIAEDLKLRPLSDFVRQDIDDEVLEHMPQKQRAKFQERHPKKEQWHDPKDGLKTVTGLLAYLRRVGQPTAIRTYGHALDGEVFEWVIWDLDAYERILRKAQDQNDQFGIFAG